MTRVRKFSKVLICIAMPLFIIALFIMCVEVFCSDEAWLRREYESIEGMSDYSGMSTDDMTRAFLRMTDYMKGNVDSMDITVTCDGEQVAMYNESEIAHMHDVRALYSGIMLAKWCILGFTLIAVAFAAYCYRRDTLKVICKPLVVALISLAAFFAVLGLWALLDFDSFWQVFHIVFLDLESSTFDPAYSRMIRICPAELFLDMVLRMFIWWAGISTALTAGVCALNALIKKRGVRKG